MKILIYIVFALLLTFIPPRKKYPTAQIKKSQTINHVGAAQGISYINDTLFVYGDREIGMMRAYHWRNDSLIYLNKEYTFTKDKEDIINHPTGIAYNGEGPTFIGNSVRMNKEGTLWKALIYEVDWNRFLTSGNLDKSLLHIIEDDACIQGTRPEYVKYDNQWAVATADYGNKANEVRLYDPIALSKAQKTSAPGVLIGKFTCSPWVQNLKWIPEKDMLVLIQNQIEGKKWRLSFLNLTESIKKGKEVIISVIDLDKQDELEGFTFLTDLTKGIGVSSSSKNNVSLLEFKW